MQWGEFQSCSGESYREKGMKWQKATETITLKPTSTEKGQQLCCKTNLGELFSALPLPRDFPHAPSKCHSAMSQLATFLLWHTGQDWPTQEYALPDLLHPEVFSLIMLLPLRSVRVWMSYSSVRMYPAKKTKKPHQIKKACPYFK